jgi:class 3 adenylate cyclase/tetratricopeptide (TPR) repeat protein
LRVICPACRAESREGARFCAECGTALALHCPSCGAEHRAGARFCEQCGTTLATAETPAPAAAVAERRLVSVLFADLVGFTPLSESRDPEEVRELLSRYFDSCRRLIELYGGSVEKFIGDAVMAVWGTPVAQEDDAERAVRTALDLVAAVSALGDEVGAPELRARAGVLTGEAAVTLGAEGQGMVAGDLVNTAARIQASAEPGTVLVGETTRRASEAAVVFETVGEHALKGKAEPVQLYRAVRVAAARGGALRSSGLEAPFVGRERELRLVKELFHASAEQGRAQLVSITGIAGIGKSRLAWEFFKYIDGLAEVVRWHRGRCLAYGEGVAYWALAEMVRARAGIVEGEEHRDARPKLAACLAENVPDPEERAWIEPRLANLLGLEERTDSDRQDLFAAWRLFFERLADKNPVVLVFEDLQWADQALLAFVEYLLEWSAGQRIYVLSLARPELTQHSPDFGRAVRNAATLALEPLSGEQMGALLDGYVPGLPTELRERVLERAQGVPLYAVETVRMLLDRGMLVEEGSVYRPTGAIETLEVPETLHALVAARLDGLAPDERRLVQDACVLGKTFTKQALAALAGRPEDELAPLLASLVRKEVLSAQADPRAPEHGQYGFLQELLRQVAYDTLSRRDRKARHLAAVAALEQSFQGVDQDVPEVLATHLLAAYEAAPDDADASDIRFRARGALAQAGERAAALAAPEEGRRYLDQAAALAEDEPASRAGLLERAGRLAFEAGQIPQARERLEQAVTLYEELGDTHGAALARVGLADIDHAEGRLEEAARRLEAALPTLELAGPSHELAASLAQLGRMRMLSGEFDAAGTSLERALEIAESLALDEVIAQAMISKSLVLQFAGRLVECRVVMEGALALGRARELYEVVWRAGNNLNELFQDADLPAQAIEILSEIEAVSRLRGVREKLVAARLTAIRPLFEVGRWDEVVTRVGEASQLESSDWARSEAGYAVCVYCERGELAHAEALLREFEWTREAEQPEMPASFAVVEARLLRAQNRAAEALVAAERGFAFRSVLAITSTHVKRCLVEALEAALALGDASKADAFLGELEALLPGEITPALRGERARFRARIAASNGRDEDVDMNFRAAATAFQELGLPFRLAVTQLEHAEWLAASGREDEATVLLAEARAAFEQLGAAPWLDRLDTGAGRALAMPVS